MTVFAVILALAITPAAPAGAQQATAQQSAPSVPPSIPQPSVSQAPAPNAPRPLSPATPPPVAPLVPPVFASPGGTAPARTLTLAQVVNLAVNSNTSVILARQRLQQAQELINQVNAQGKPQTGLDLADTYTDYGTTTASLPAVSVANPILPGGATIPTITDQAGGVSTAFNSTIAAATGASSAGTSTAGTGTISGVGTGSTTGANGIDSTLPGATTPGSAGTVPGATGTTAPGSTTAPGAGTTGGTGGAGTTPGTSTPGATTPGTTTPGTTPGTTTPGTTTPDTSGGAGAGTSGGTGTSGASGASGAASSSVPQTAQAQIALAPLPSIVQEYVTEESQAAPAEAAPTPAEHASAQPDAQQPRQPGDTTTPTTTGGGVGAVTTNHNNYGGRLSLTQYIDAFGLLGTARSVERETRDFYALDLIRVQNEAALAAKNLYFTVLLNQANVATQQEQVRFAAEDLRITQAQLGQGVVARFNVLTAQTVLANAQEALSSAQDQLSVAQANLDFLLGVPSTTPVALVVPPLPPLDQAISLPQTTRTAFQRRPELRQAQNNIAIAQKLVRFANSTLTPTVGLVGVAGYNSTGIPTLPQKTLAVTAQVDIPFTDGGATRSRVRSAQVAVQTQITTRNQLQLSVALEVQTAILNIEDAQTRTRTAQTALTSAEEEVRVANVRYQNGLGTFLDVTNALAQLSQARTNLANAEFGYQTSLAALVRAIGDR